MASMRATRSVREILLTTAPLALAAFVFAVSFRVLSIAARVPGWAAGLMSALVFAGSAAFPARVTALLWPMLAGRHAVRCAIGGALVALVLAPFTPPGVPLAGAAVVGLWLAR